MSLYAIDEQATTATGLWNYQPDLLSPFCSSVYRRGSNYLVTHSNVSIGVGIGAVIQGIDPMGEILFELRTGVNPLSFCRPWNAKIIALENLRFTSSP